MVFCDDGAVVGRPYCPVHCAVAYPAQQARLAESVEYLGAVGPRFATLLESDEHATEGNVL